MLEEKKSEISVGRWRMDVGSKKQVFVTSPCDAMLCILVEVTAVTIFSTCFFSNLQLY